MDEKQYFICIVAVLITNLSLFPLVLGAECDASKCKLPDCFCPSNVGPASVPENETVQMVVFTFDDAVNERNEKYYYDLFSNDRRNPNGCPIRSTLFVSNQWTDYKMVNKLYKAGHEIGSHSITHKLPRVWWSKDASYEDWEYEIDGQRKFLHEKGKIPMEHLRGMRVPFLQIGHDNQFKMLQDKKYLYDASFMIQGPYNEGDKTKPVWPFTLDYKTRIEYCDSVYCPKKTYPGLWEVPLNRWIVSKWGACVMVDACGIIKTKEDVLHYLRRNFNRHYIHRVPFGINMHMVWFDKNKAHLEGMHMFIKELLEKDDVYFVTVQQMLAWMRQPTPLSELKSFQPFKVSCKAIGTSGSGTSRGTLLFVNAYIFFLTTSLAWIFVKT